MNGGAGLPKCDKITKMSRKRASNLTQTLSPQPGSLRRGRAAGYAAALLIIIFCASTALAWGPKGHVLVTKWAVETLPDPLKGYFEAYQQELLAHVNDPDEWMKKDRFEAFRHYIYLDEYGRFPYLKLPHSYQAAIRNFGAGRVMQRGTLPWQIGEFSLRLTTDMRQGKWDQARKDAAVLGYYIADAHDPLNTTDNFNGQLTGQTGLSARFGANLIDRYRNFILFRPEPAQRISDPTGYAFGMVIEANTWVNNILLGDLRARDDLPGYNDDYYDRFYSATSSILMHELSGAANDIGSYWYTAWLNAGKPSLASQ